jgi:NAD(P)H-flavin reductase
VISPEYIVGRHITSNTMLPQFISDKLPLVQDAVNLIAKTDTFSISFVDQEVGRKTDHHYGPPGFISLQANDVGNCSILYPEEIGVRRYQTLGDRKSLLEAGLIIPDYTNGNVLYLTGTKEILTRDDAIRVLPRVNVAVSIHVKAVRFVRNGLTIRVHSKPFPLHSKQEQHPAKKKHHHPPNDNCYTYLTVVDKQLLTPNIARFQFHMADQGKTPDWRPGQYAIMSFQGEANVVSDCVQDGVLDEKSEVHDRMFTVSSGPGALLSRNLFEITIRRVGVVTERLFGYPDIETVPVLLHEFKGDFCFRQDHDEYISVVAGGIGVTPLLAQASYLDLDRVRVYWSLRLEDLGLAIDSFRRIPGLGASTTLFLTGTPNTNHEVEGNLAILKSMDISVFMRRILVGDLRMEPAMSLNVGNWYICTGASLRNTLLQWLKGQNVIFETFNY